MYISVENYKEMYLNGKDAAAVAEEIQKIRRQIARAKEKLESPANVYDSYANESETSVIDIYKGYLNAALGHLSALTGLPCELTEEEKASLIFDSTVDDISCITLTAGRYLQDKYELTFNGDVAEICELHLGDDSVCRGIDLSHARKTVKALHIGEWKETYTPEQYGCTLNEPTKWQLRIDYRSGSAPRFYDGFGIFPYNFDVLARLLGADII